MLSWLTGGVAKSIEGVAKEWIETDGEKAEAKALMIKTLDPNGLMRRDIARAVTQLYALFIIISLILLTLQAFDLSPVVQAGDESVRSVDVAANGIKELFQPITILFGSIVTASFGVNGVNAYRGK